MKSTYIIIKKIALVLLITCNGFMLAQNKDLDKSLKLDKKLNGYYVAQLSKNITPEKFNEWEKKNPQFKILSTKQSSCLIYGVTKKCISEVGFLPVNEDGLIVPPSGKLFKMTKDGRETTFDSYENEKQGLIKVKLGNNWGCIDKTGKEIIPIQYSGIDIQNNGLVRANQNNKSGYFNTLGSPVSPMYDFIGTFFNGIAKVKLNEKYGFINDVAKEVISLKYEDANDYSDGLITVKQNGKWGYIDKTGVEIIPLQYDYTGDFKSGTALVYVNLKYGCIDKTGKAKLPIKYSSLPGCSNDDIAKVLIEEGTFTGKATYVYSFGTYNGDFVNGRPHGKGNLDYGGGSWYNGDFVNGQRHGKGEERLKEKGEMFGFRMSGDYTNNKKHGRFKAWQGSWLTGTDEWYLEFENGKLVDYDKTKTAMSDFVNELNGSNSSYSYSNSSKSKNEQPKEINIPQVKTFKFVNETSNGDFDTVEVYDVEFKDGTKGILYKYTKAKNKKWYISDGLGIYASRWYFSLKEDAIKGLYLYKNDYKDELEKISE